VSDSAATEPGRRDAQSVTPEGKRVLKLIHGVEVREATTIADERGEICEIFNPAWGVLPEPLVYAYLTAVQPGRIKGWVYHRLQHDRLFVAKGRLKIVLHDLRDDSPTRGMTNELCLTERNRGLVVIPVLVAHAVQNVGDCEALFVNLPTRPYDHANPDKYRIAIESGAIPYDFSPRAGW